MAKKKLADYLPKNVDETTILIQAKINPELHTKVKSQMKTDNISWHELIVASLEYYLDEKKAS